MPYLSEQLLGCNKNQGSKRSRAACEGPGNRRRGRALSRKEACLQGLALVPERGESSWGWKAGWRPEVCLTRAWRPSGPGIQGAASGAQLGEAWKKAVEQGRALRADLWPWANDIPSPPDLAMHISQSLPPGKCQVAPAVQRGAGGKGAENRTVIWATLVEGPGRQQ